MNDILTSVEHRRQIRREAWICGISGHETFGTIVCYFRDIWACRIFSMHIVFISLWSAGAGGGHTVSDGDEPRSRCWENRDWNGDWLRSEWSEVILLMDHFVCLWQAFRPVMIMHGALLQPVVDWFFAGIPWVVVRCSSRHGKCWQSWRFWNDTGWSASNRGMLIGWMGYCHLIS